MSSRLLRFDRTLAVLVVVVAITVIAVPLTVAEYPPMVDLPQHAAQTSALRHYFDPAYGFRDQFELQPFAVPYLSMYVLGALFMTVLPTLAAVKLSVAVMLALLPVGLAVLFRGMKKSPLLGIAGLAAVWGPLTHWGFLNFLGALGLFAMAVGLSLLVVERPTRSRQVGLLAVLLALFFTHVVRFPLAMAAVGWTGLVMALMGRSVRALLLPLCASLVLFALWLVARPASLRVDLGPLGLHIDRLQQLTGWLYGDFNDARERPAFEHGVEILAVVALGCGVLHAFRFASPAWRSPWRARWAIGAWVVVFGVVLSSLLLYLVLPMAAGTWFFIFPREASALCYLGLGLLPDLPRARPLRAAAVLGLAAVALPLNVVVARNYAQFDQATQDFAQIVASMPPAPRLLYLIYDHRGSTRTLSPFTHLPAYIQAERGGVLSHHFARFGASPLTYRDDRPEVVPPPMPRQWEVHPEWFDLRLHGRFFDWFLIRGIPCPDALFRADPSIRLDRQVGFWWLYRRDAKAVGAGHAGGSTP